MKTPTSLIALSLCATSSFATAGTAVLDASSAHAALSGVHYTCDLGEMKFDMVFKDVDANSQAFPYEFRAGERVSEDAYILTTSGDIHLQSAEDIRYLTLDQGTLKIAKTPDGRAANCVAK